MKNKQRLHEGDRTHPDIVALDSLSFSYKGWETDKEEAIRRHTGDCMTFNLGSYGFESLLNKMKKKQKMHQDRDSLPGLVELDNEVFSYPGWEVDRAICEKFFVEYSTSSTADCFYRKFVAMKNKQKLFEGDRSHPEVRALDETHLSYDGWEDDKKEAERRLTGDCILLHMGSIGFNDIFCKMKKKQALHIDRSSIQCLMDLDALAGTSAITAVTQQHQVRTNAPTLANQTMTSQPTALQETPIKKEQWETSIAKATSENKCVICLENQPTHAHIPCGHLCVCGQSSARYDSAGDSCPLCRERSYCVTKIYC
jgi:Zinc finger, C3HC4 type (RING finger)